MVFILFNLFPILSRLFFFVCYLSLFLLWRGVGRRSDLTQVFFSFSFVSSFSCWWLVSTSSDRNPPTPPPRVSIPPSFFRQIKDLWDSIELSSFLTTTNTTHLMFFFSHSSPSPPPFFFGWWPGIRWVSNLSNRLDSPRPDFLYFFIFFFFFRHVLILLLSSSLIW